MGGTIMLEVGRVESHSVRAGSSIIISSRGGDIGIGVSAILGTLLVVPVPFESSSSFLSSPIMKGQSTIFKL